MAVWTSEPLWSRDLQNPAFLPADLWGRVAFFCMIQVSVHEFPVWCGISLNREHNAIFQELLILVHSPEPWKLHSYLLWQWEHSFWFGLQLRWRHTCSPQRSWRNIHFQPPVRWWWCNCGGSAQRTCTIPLKIRTRALFAVLPLCVSGRISFTIVFLSAFWIV